MENKTYGSLADYFESAREKETSEFESRIRSLKESFPSISAEYLRLSKHKLLIEEYLSGVEFFKVPDQKPSLTGSSLDRLCGWDI